MFNLNSMLRCELSQEQSTQHRFHGYMCYTTLPQHNRKLAALKCGKAVLTSLGTTFLDTEMKSSNFNINVAWEQFCIEKPNFSNKSLILVQNWRDS